MDGDGGEPEWQAELLRTLGRVMTIGGVPAAAHVILAFTGLPLRTVVAAFIVVAGCAVAGFARGLPLRVQGALICAPLLLLVLVGSYDLGPRPATILGIPVAGLIVLLVAGWRWAATVIALAALAFCLAGFAGRHGAAVRAAVEFERLDVWVRQGVVIASLSTVLVFAVARALRRIEDARSKLARAYDELGQVTRRMEAALDEERRRIARELHDELGQALTAMKLHVELLAPAVPPAHAGRVADIVAVAERTIQSVRELSRLLRPPMLDDLGLVAALQALLDEHAARGEVRFTLHAPEDGDRFPEEIETAIFRVVQEAISNTLRHADAREVSVILDHGPAGVRVRVRDDGCGFDPRAVRTKGRAHLGLVGMRERARALGGTCTVSSARGSGTEIVVRLPLPGAD